MSTINMPKELTAENGAKGLLTGEFYVSSEISCPECLDVGEIEEECHICFGSGAATNKTAIDWTTIKEIYAMAVKHLGT